MSIIDQTNNKDLINNIKKSAEQIINNLLNKYSNNNYVLNKMNNYINNLPIYLENDNTNNIKKIEKQDKIAEYSKQFIENYINSNNYYYCNSSEIYFKYDNYNYFTYRVDTILYEIGNLINRDDTLVNYKNKIKTSIIKEIHERNISDTIPDTNTIQLVVNSLMPIFLNNKTYVKYFLIIIGDSILKKNEEYTYLIDNTCKKFIKLLSQLAYQYFGSNNFTNIKYGYHEIQKNCRIIYIDKNLFTNKHNNIIDNLILNLNCKNNNNFLDLFIVGLYYSNRYENSDVFLFNYDCDSTIKDNIMLLDNINILIDKFIDNTIENCVNEDIDNSNIKNSNIKNSNIKINNKKMSYLWKLFLLENSLPNINLCTNFRSILRSKIEYNDNNDYYIGVTSKKLPLISCFMEFWNTTMIFDVNNSTVDVILEISEIVSLFKYWISLNDRMLSNISISEITVQNLIMHFYESIIIEEDKYILNIKCKLWDKNKSIIDFIEYYKNEYLKNEYLKNEYLKNEYLNNKIKKELVNVNNFYSIYCKWCKLNECKFIVGKCYFNKFIINYLDNYIKYDSTYKIAFIKTDYFLSGN